MTPRGHTVLDQRKADRRVSPAVGEHAMVLLAQANERVRVLTEALAGVRTLAAVDAAYGSQAWRCAIENIDAALEPINAAGLISRPDISARTDEGSVPAAPLSIEECIMDWSLRPQPGTPTGDAWEQGARQGWEWGRLRTSGDGETGK